MRAILHIALEGLGADAPSLGEFTIALTSIVVPALSGIVVAWLRSRAGNKASLKIGNIEAEARTPEDIERLFKIAVEFDRNRPSHKHDEP